LLTRRVIVAASEALKMLGRSKSRTRDRESVVLKETSIRIDAVSGELKSAATVLREPLVRYYTDTYNGFISVVEGVALAALLVENRTPLLDSAPHWDAWGKGITAALVIAQLWHRYVTGNQFLASRPGVMEAILPMLLAVSQIALGLSIQNTRGLFSFWMFCVALVGAASFQNRIYRSTRPGFRREMRDVLGGTELATDKGASRLCKGILEFQRQGRTDAVLGCVLFAGCCALTFWSVIPEPLGRHFESGFMFVATSWVYLRLYFHGNLPTKLESALRES